MAMYGPIHDNFVRFCQARAYGIMSYEDLMNETLLRAYERWDTMKKKDALLYFLFGTARNIVLNTIRKRKEVGLDGVDEGSTPNAGELNLEVQYLYEQLNQLSDNKKEVLILFEISGFSIKEIADMQHTTAAAVKMMLSRARKELKKLVESHAVAPKKVPHE